MTSKPLKTETLAWQIERYVLGDEALGDETVDRTEFEERMAEDPELALAVARAVYDLEQISEAALLPRRLSTTLSKDSFPTPARWLAAIGTVAMILVCVFSLSDLGKAGRDPYIASTNTSELGESGSLLEVAENWLAFNTSEIQENGLSAQGITEQANTEQNFELDFDNDWMQEAAQQFFLEMDI